MKEKGWFSGINGMMKKEAMKGGEYIE